MIVGQIVELFVKSGSRDDGDDEVDDVWRCDCDHQ